MNWFSRCLSKLSTGAVLLVVTALCHSPAHAEFGLSAVEFSPFRLAVSVNNDEYETYSGSVNFELGDPTTELAIPFLWTRNKEDSEYYNPHESFVVDLQWRKFNKPKRTGGYVGLVARAVRADGWEYDGNTGLPTTSQDELDFGLGVVAGFRRNISAGFFWGANVNMVAFGKEPKDLTLDEGEAFRQKVSITVDFLKFGYQF